MAESGAEAIEMVKLRHARRGDYNLLLIDWRMPEMDGVETTRQIRSIVGHDTPIIILTSYSWDEMADEAKSAVWIPLCPSRCLPAASWMNSGRLSRKKMRRRDEARRSEGPARPAGRRCGRSMPEIMSWC